MLQLKKKSILNVACLSCAAQVFQRRHNGSVDFFRNWTDYKSGFGSIGGEFWLGNDNIHSLTSNGSNVLRIDMEAFDGETRFAQYTGFSVDDESANYALRLSSYLTTSTARELNLNRSPHMHARSNARTLTHARTHAERRSPSYTFTTHMRTHIRTEIMLTGMLVWVYARPTACRALLHNVL